MDRLCAHALAGSCCGLGLKPETLTRASPCPSAWTACGFGAQAFSGASKFNANIGAWNTASVLGMADVCAAPGAAARTMADALGRASMRLGRLCAAAPPMRACAHVQAFASGMFSYTGFNQNIGGWNTARVTSMGSMFYKSFFNQNIASWNVLRVTDLNDMFDSGVLSSCNKGAIYRHWGATLRTAYPGFSSMCGASCSLTCLTDANIGTAATAWLTSPSTAATTYGPIADWDTSAVTSIATLFYPSSTARPTFNADISKWNVASVSNMCQVRLASCRCS
jgi:hypothetical protein